MVIHHIAKGPREVFHEAVEDHTETCAKIGKEPQKTYSGQVMFRVYKKSPDTGAMLWFIGHALMENRSGLIVQGDLTQADCHAERRAALVMIHRHSPGSTRQLTLGADKGFDTAEFVADLRQSCVTPHVAQKWRYTAIDGRTTRHDGYAKSQRDRKRVEEAFGWAKTVGGMAQTVYRGVESVRSRLIMTMAANKLTRLPRLLAA